MILKKIDNMISYSQFSNFDQKLYYFNHLNVRVQTISQLLSEFIMTND